jgi:hypothetical protein
MSTPTDVSKKVIDLNKAIITNSIGTAKDVMSVVYDGVTAATRTARDAGATVAGQSRSAAERTTASARTGAKQVTGQARSAAKRTAATAKGGASEVTGQARAQGERASGRIETIAGRTADRAIDAVDGSPSSGTPYESWTKDELYERAQELDIDGRSTMNKRQLIQALRA